MVPEPEQLFKLILKSKKFPSTLRLLLISNNDFIRVYNKRITARFNSSSVLSSIKGLKCDRGQILDIFGKLEFFINEIIQLEILGPHSEKVEMFDNILASVDFFSRIKLLFDWGIIDKSLKEALMQTKQVRNGLAHRWDEVEVNYKGKVLKDNISALQKDLEYIWVEIIKIYKKEQQQINLGKIITEIEALNK